MFLIGQYILEEVSLYRKVEKSSNNEKKNKLANIFTMFSPVLCTFIQIQFVKVTHCGWKLMEKIMLVDDEEELC